jgi:patatin-like phospholipase/acyl hydrolase
LAAKTMVDIYRNRIRDIFKPWKPWNEIRRVATGRKYDIANLVKVLRDELGPAASWKLNNSPIDILITAKGLADGKPWYFVRDNPNNAQTTGNLPLLDCAAASAAAPTYFDPFVMPEPQGKLVDGGVGVTGNPVYQACIEAFCYSEGYLPENTTVVSFGTGRYQEVADPHGLLGWLDWTVGTVLHAPVEQQTEIVARHYPELTLYRLEPQLTAKIDLDDVDRIGELDTAGQQFAARIDWDSILSGAENEFRVHPPKCAKMSF